MANSSPRTYIYGIIVFTFVILGGISLYSGFAAQNDALAGYSKYGSFNSTFDRYTELNSSVSSIQTSITDSDAEIGVFGVLNGLINTAWNGLKFLFSSFGFMSDVGQGLTDVFGVPSWIPGLVLLAVTVMLAFTIWSAIFQSEL